MTHQFGHLKQKLCEICKTLFLPNSPRQKYCNECRDNGSVIKYRKELYNYGVCQNCGRKTKRESRWCNNPKCQEVKKEFYKRQAAANKLRREKEYKSLHRSLKLQDKKNIKNSKYLCRRCGKNAYPNRFYCPICHAIVGKNAPFDNEFVLHLKHSEATETFFNLLTEFTND